MNQLLRFMQRDDIARTLIGLMALLLPYAGSLTVLPLGTIILFDPGSRLLSASLAMLLLLRPALSIMHCNLPLYIIAISFVASTFAPLAFKRLESLAGSMIYLRKPVV
jgi:hypothetical protein